MESETAMAARVRRNVCRKPFIEEARHSLYDLASFPIFFYEEISFAGRVREYIAEDVELDQHAQAISELHSVSPTTR
jgi:hypothetical protein